NALSAVICSFIACPLLKRFPMFRIVLFPRMRRYPASDTKQCPPSSQMQAPVTLRAWFLVSLVQYQSGQRPPSPLLVNQASSGVLYLRHTPEKPEGCSRCVPAWSFSCPPLKHCSHVTRKPGAAVQHESNVVGGAY